MGELRLHTELQKGKKFNLDRFQRLLKEAPHLAFEVDRHNGYTPLIQAANVGNKEALLLLLEQDEIGVNDCDFRHDSALVHTIQNERDECFEILLHSKQVDLNMEYASGHTALTHAVFAARLDYILELLKAGAVSWPVDNRQTPLHQLASLSLPSLLSINRAYQFHGRESITKLLVECARIMITLGTDIMAADYDNKTVLHYCCKYNIPALLELLLDNLSVDQRKLATRMESASQCTPLMYCCRPIDDSNENYLWPGDHNFGLDCARLLIEAGAEVNHRTRRSHLTPLLKLAFYDELEPHQLKIAQLLLEKGAKSDITLGDTHNVYHHVITNRNPKFLKILLDCDLRSGFGAFVCCHEQEDSKVLDLNEIFVYALKCLEDSYTENTPSEPPPLVVDCIGLLLARGACMKKGIRFVLDSIKEKSSIFVIKVLFGCGLNLSNFTDICLVSKSILASNYPLTRLLLKEGARTDIIKRETLCTGKNKDLSKHRTIEYITCASLFEEYQRTADEYYVGCSKCSTTVAPTSKVVCCPDPACEMFVCESCFFMKSREEKRISSSLDAALRKNEPQDINLLNAANKALGARLLGDPRTSVFLDAFQQAGILSLPPHLVLDEVIATILSGLGYNKDSSEWKLLKNVLNYRK